MEAEQTSRFGRAAGGTGQVDAYRSENYLASYPREQFEAGSEKNRRHAHLKRIL